MGADADSILQILIDLKVVGKEDVKAANDLLAQSGAATKETGKAADFLNPAMASSGKAMNEAAGNGKTLFENHRLLHAAMHQTGAQIPGLSALLRGLMNPETIGLVAGMTAIQLYFEHLKKVQEKQLEWIQALQKTNDSLHEITSSGKSAGEQFVEINQALAEGQVKAHGYAHDIETMTQVWKIYDEQVKDSASAQQQADSDAATALKTRIDLMEKAGVISKQVADDMRAEAVYQAELDKVNAEKKAKEAQYQNLTREQGEAMRKRNALGSEEDAQKKLTSDQAALARNESNIEKLPNIIRDLNSDLKAALNKNDFKEVGRIRDEINRMQGVLDKAKADNPELEKRVAKDKDTIAAQATLDKTINDLTSQMNVLNESIVDFNKTSQAHLDQVATERNRTEFGGGATALMKHAEDIAKRYQQVLAGRANPNSVSQQELAELIRISEAATGHSQNAKTAMGTMLAAAKNMEVFGKDVDRMVGIMEQVAYALPNNLSNRLQAIEAAIARGNRPRS